MNTNLRCIILDENQDATLQLEEHIQNIPTLEMAGKFKDPFEALNFIQFQRIDLIFLDIQLPRLTGIEFLKTLQERPMVIFTTAYPEYALDGYEMDIVDYLLKPIRFGRLVKAVNKASRRLQSNLKSTHRPYPIPISVLENRSTKDYMLVKSEYKIHKIKYDQICYIKGMKEYVSFNLHSGRVFSLLSLKSLEKALPEDRFMRIHKSYIVSIEKVSTLEGNQVQIGQEKLPIGSSYKDRVLDQIF